LEKAFVAAEIDIPENVDLVAEFGEVATADFEERDGLACFCWGAAADENCGVGGEVWVYAVFV
jgi:hypothetical protein